MANDKKRIFAVVGPTAGGKTALAIELAKRLDGEVISCDSMQIYRGMDIGTAKPSNEEMQGVTHHMLDVADPRLTFSSEDYSLLAEKCIDDIVSRGKMPIFCGGTGLYLDCVLRGVRDDGANEDPKFRAEMESLAAMYGNGYVHARLAEIDPEAAQAIHENNLKRVIRALEVYHMTGKTKTELDRISRTAESKYEAKIIYLCFNSRELLYERINRRVDIMLENGLEKEVRKLYESGALCGDTTAGQAIGYKEMLKYIEGQITLSEAADEIKQNSRRYAKRQLTWFGAKEGFYKLYVDDEKGVRELCDIANDAENYLI